MKDAISIMLGLGLILGVAICVLKCVDRLTGRRRKGEGGRSFDERLHDPDFEGLEHHYGCQLPDALKRLYADRNELERGNFTVVAPESDPDDEQAPFIAFYVPADSEAARSGFPGTEPYFRFADDGCGNAYMTDPRLDDGPVLFHDHETGEISEVCDSFSRFMSWPRRD